RSGAASPTSANRSGSTRVPGGPTAGLPSRVAVSGAGTLRRRSPKGTPVNERRQHGQQEFGREVVRRQGRQQRRRPQPERYYRAVRHTRDRAAAPEDDGDRGRQGQGKREEVAGGTGLRQACHTGGVSGGPQHRGDQDQ